MCDWLEMRKKREKRSLSLWTIAVSIGILQREFFEIKGEIFLIDYLVLRRETLIFSTSRKDFCFFSFEKIPVCGVCREEQQRVWLMYLCAYGHHPKKELMSDILGQCWAWNILKFFFFVPFGFFCLVPLGSSHGMLMKWFRYVYTHERVFIGGFAIIAAETVSLMLLKYNKNIWMDFHIFT